MRRAALGLALALTLPTAAAAQAPLVAQGCLGCHGASGAGSAAIPGLSGRPAAELASAMRAFAAKERQGTIMGRIARGYTEAEITALAAHFAALPAGGSR